MKTLSEVKAALSAQKSTWLKSTTLWSDFDADFETGNRMHAESVKHDFLEENDVVDHFETDDSDDIGVAAELRQQAMEDTLQAMDLY